MTEKELIVHNAKILVGLKETVHDTYIECNRSDSHLVAWKQACEEFNARYWTLFYPGGQERLIGLRHCDRKSIETALNFLEADPFYFRSGYTKEYIWKYIPNCQLNGSEIDRLHFAGISYTKHQIKREFWYMCRAMTRLPANGFWEDVHQKMQDKDPLIKERASYLFAYSKGIEQGEMMRRSVRVHIGQGKTLHDPIIRFHYRK